MKKVIGLLAVVSLISACASTPSTSTNAPAVNLGVSLTDAAWNGTKLPPGQQCKKNGGNGATPAMSVTNVPAGTVEFHVSYSDVSWEGGKNGFHGVIGHAHTGGSNAVLISVPGDILTGYPEGTRLIKDNRGFGAWKNHDGYMPPCSAPNRTNTYVAKVSAVDASGKTLAETDIQIAKY